MSEEELIKVITYKLNMKNTDVYAPILYEEIQGLLDLYNKEKEKNKELENADLTTVYIKGVYDERDKWKEKVKELIKEIDDDNTDESWWYINKIQQLLQ